LSLAKVGKGGTGPFREKELKSKRVPEAWNRPVKRTDHITTEYKQFVQGANEGAIQ